MIVIVKKCEDCPFAGMEDGLHVCSVATPKNRPLHDYPKRPDWCRLSREQVIVREFQ